MRNRQLYYSAVFTNQPNHYIREHPDVTTFVQESQDWSILGHNKLFALGICVENNWQRPVQMALASRKLKGKLMHSRENVG